MDDENDLDNIFKEYEREVDQESANEQGNDENSANAESNEVQTREIVPVPKRTIRNPRLKFNAERLCGERGIPIVTKHFKNVKFKGKGHEKEDLNKLLSTLEHWTHRLFPSMKFEACLKQIEKLGKKRAVQTCLVKIRRDMPILSSDFVHDKEDDEREGELMPTEVEELPSEDAFDRLFGGTERAEVSSNLTSTPQNKPSSGVVLGSSFGSSLTEEQRKRIEYNKMLATERRKAKMASTLATNAENSGRQSPSMLDPVHADTNDSGSYSQENLERQFDSLFDGANNHEKVAESRHSEGNPPTEEDYQMGSQDYDETKELSLNVNQQFESLLENPSHKASTSEDGNKDWPENRQQTCEDTTMKLQESDLNESVENNYKSSEDVFGSLQRDSDFEKNGSMLNESSQPSVMDQCKSIQGATVKEISENFEDSVMNTEEPISDTSKNSQCPSTFPTNESETEELGLDELMDLVDEDVV